MSYEATLFDGLEDIAAEALWEQQERANNRVVFVKEPVWITKDGRVIKVCDMDTKHIKNCIHMIYQSNGSWRAPYLRIFEEELRKRKFAQGRPCYDEKTIGRIVATVLRCI